LLRHDECQNDSGALLSQKGSKKKGGGQENEIKKTKENRKEERKERKINKRKNVRGENQNTWSLL
jgi:hypothetical protein